VTLWDQKAVFYNRIRTLPLISSFLKIELRNLKAILQDQHIETERVIDLGTGSGAHLSLLPKSVLFVGLDRSLKMIQQARKRHPNIQGVVADANHLPFHSNFCGFVLAVGLAEYIKDKNLWFEEIGRVIKAGGLMLLTFSPPGILTHLRNFLGHSIYPVSLMDFQKLISTHHLELVQWKQSMLQIQCLLRKNDI